MVYREFKDGIIDALQQKIVVALEKKRQEIAQGFFKENEEVEEGLMNIFKKKPAQKNPAQKKQKISSGAPKKHFTE